MVSQGLISISILDWRGEDNEDEAEQKNVNKRNKNKTKKSTNRNESSAQAIADSKRGWSIYTVGLCGLCVIASAHWYFDLFLSSWWNIQGALGWAIFCAAILSTLAGAHLMW